MHSDFPRELVIARRNGSRIMIEVEYPWLPTKCKICNAFGHATYACSKKDNKIRVPKDKGVKVSQGLNLKQ